MNLILIIKNQIRYILWLVHLREYLPKSVINSVVILENKEDVVGVKQTEKLKFASYNKDLNPTLRKKVSDKLYRASESLPNGYSLLLIEAYRSKERQQRKWDEQYQKIKTNNPLLLENEIMRLTRLVVAEPTGEGPHQTGAAVDVSLTYNGTELDMGTKWCEFNSKTQTSSKKINLEQSQNRNLLMSIMRKTGFVNYPGEWWHFSYGDRMWAAYSRKKTCMYGPIDINISEEAPN